MPLFSAAAAATLASYLLPATPYVVATASTAATGGAANIVFGFALGGGCSFGTYKAWEYFFSENNNDKPEMTSEMQVEFLMQLRKALKQVTDENIKLVQKLATEKSSVKTAVNSIVSVDQNIEDVKSSVSDSNQEVASNLTTLEAAILEVKQSSDLKIKALEEENSKLLTKYNQVKELYTKAVNKFTIERNDFAKQVDTLKGELNKSKLKSQLVKCNLLHTNVNELKELKERLDSISVELKLSQEKLLKSKKQLSNYSSSDPSVRESLIQFGLFDLNSELSASAVTKDNNLSLRARV